MTTWQICLGVLALTALSRKWFMHVCQTVICATRARTRDSHNIKSAVQHVVRGASFTCLTMTQLVPRRLSKMRLRKRAIIALYFAS